MTVILILCSRQENYKGIEHIIDAKKTVKPLLYRRINNSTEINFWKKNPNPTFK